MSKPKLLRIFDNNTSKCAYSRLNNPISVIQNSNRLECNDPDGPPLELSNNALLTFRAPCSSSEVEYLEINYNQYEITDSNGVSIGKTPCVWDKGALVSVIIDTENYRAYLQNLSSHAGVATSKGGIIFNDYEHNEAELNAVAFGSWSKAKGENSIAGGDRKEASGPDYNEPGFDESMWRCNETIGAGSLAIGMGAIAYARASKSFGYRTQTGYPPEEKYYQERPEAVTPVIFTVKEKSEGVKDLRISPDTISYTASGVYDNKGVLLSKGHTFDATLDDSYRVIMTLQGHPIDDNSSMDIYCVIPGSDIDGEYVLDKSNNFSLTLESSYGTAKEIRITETFSNADDYVKVTIRCVTFKDHTKGQAAVAIGSDTVATGNNSLAGGYMSVASNTNSLAFGSTAKDSAGSVIRTTASGASSIALGSGAIASGTTSLAFGLLAIASGNYSVALGNKVTSSGQNCLAIGLNTTASGDRAFAAGNATKSAGICTVAFGNGTLAEGNSSVVMGWQSYTKGAYSFAAGTGARTEKDADSSISLGFWTRTRAKAQAAFGMYNDDTEKDALFMVGNGESNTKRNNAFVVYEDGSVNVSGKLSFHSIDESSAYMVRDILEGNIYTGNDYMDGPPDEDGKFTGQMCIGSDGEDVNIYMWVGAINRWINIEWSQG